MLTTVFRLSVDIPVYVAHDSAEVWANPDLFFLDDFGNPLVVSGSPALIISAQPVRDGGNPIYRWGKNGTAVVFCGGSIDSV